jgi:peptide/nickel transport system permease protein
MPGDPVAAIVARMAQGQANATGVQAIYKQYTELFHTNEPMLTQFFIYIKNVLHGDFGFSFSQYPRTVASVLKVSVWWTMALQFPAIIVGFLIGNILGVLAAYLRGWYDKAIMPLSILPVVTSWYGNDNVLILALMSKFLPPQGDMALI